MKVGELHDGNFKETVIKPGLRAVIDFWGPHCAPCVGISRQIDAFAATYRGPMEFFKVNAEEAVETAAFYGVRGLPTLLLLVDGKQKATQMGALAPAKLEGLLQKWAQL